MKVNAASIDWQTVQMAGLIWPIKTICYAALGNRHRYQRLRCLQEKYGLSAGEIVLGYLLNQPFPVLALIGPKTLADLTDRLSCAHAKLAKHEIDYLEHRRCLTAVRDAFWFSQNRRIYPQIHAFANRQGQRKA
jgi:hypothetical protein